MRCMSRAISIHLYYLLSPALYSLLCLFRLLSECYQSLLAFLALVYCLRTKTAASISSSLTTVSVRASSLVLLLGSRGHSKTWPHFAARRLEWACLCVACWWRGICSLWSIYAWFAFRQLAPCSLCPKAETLAVWLVAYEQWDDLKHSQ